MLRIMISYRSSSAERQSTETGAHLDTNVHPVYASYQAELFEHDIKAQLQQLFDKILTIAITAGNILHLLNTHTLQQ